MKNLVSKVFSLNKASVAVNTVVYLLFFAAMLTLMDILLSTACSMVSAKDDLTVVGGVLLECVTVGVLVLTGLVAVDLVREIYTALKHRLEKEPQRTDVPEHVQQGSEPVASGSSMKKNNKRSSR